MRQQVFQKPPPLCEDGGMPSMLRGYAAAIVAACLSTAVRSNRRLGKPQRPCACKTSVQSRLLTLSGRPSSGSSTRTRKSKLSKRRFSFQAARSPVRDRSLSAQMSRVCTSGGISTDAISVAFTVDQTGMPVARNVDFSGKKPPLNNVFTLAILIHSRGGDEEMYIVETLAKNRRLYPGEGKGCKTIGGN